MYAELLKNELEKLEKIVKMGNKLPKMWFFLETKYLK